MPPKGSKKNRICGYCRDEDNLEMVQCDECDEWFHFACVNVGKEIENQDWMCDQCTRRADAANAPEPTPQSDATTNTRNVETIIEVAPSIQSENPISHQKPANKSLTVAQCANHRDNTVSSKCNTKCSSSTGIDLQLKRAEEERQLKLKRINQLEKIEMEYLDQKYQLLFQRDEQRSVCSGQSVQRAATARIENWVEEPAKLKIHDKEIFEVPFQEVKPSLKMKSSATDEVSTTLPPTRSQLAARSALSRDLPIFSGRPEEWPVFISQLEISTKTCGYTNCENLIRLQKSLRGPALEAVRAHLLLPAAVPEIINTLRILYGCPEKIIGNLVKQIRKEPILKADRFDALVSYAMIVRNLCYTMQATKLEAHLTNPLLLEELVDKLPPSIKLNWALHVSKKDRNITTFSDWLYEVAMAANTLTSTAPNIPNSENKRNVKLTHFVHTQESSDKVTTGNCVLCHSDHSIDSCRQFQQMSRNEKWQVIKRYKICHYCLNKHIYRRCLNIKICKIDGCLAKHHPLLHNKTVCGPPVNCNNLHQKDYSSTLLRIVPVTLYGDQKAVDTYALFDEGSSVTLIEHTLAEELKLDGEPQSLCLKWTDKTTRLEPESLKVNLRISEARHHAQKFNLENVRTVKNLSLPEQTLNIEYLTKEYAHLRGIKVQSYYKARPQILLGIEYFKLGVPIKIKEGKWDQPLATKTKLGWTIHGKCEKDIDNTKSQGKHFSFHICECQKLNDLVKESFSFDNIGIIVTKTSLSAEDKRAEAMMENVIVKRESRYEAGLLWKCDNINLPDSYPMARKRLECLERKALKDPATMSAINEQIQNLLTKGYARKLALKEQRQFNNKTWYLPIFVVRNPNKPNKIRLVWDAAAKSHNVSLNDMLLKGPDQLTNLVHVLFNFRVKRVALSGDIREMFHQVQIKQEDQHAQRFLWRGGELDRPPDVYCMNVMIFGANCSPSIAQYVKNKNALLYKDEFPEAASAIIDNHYVDDLLYSTDTEEEAIRIGQEIKMIHEKAGFEIRNWVSNSRKVLTVLDNKTSSQSKEISQLTAANVVNSTDAAKMLGLWWLPASDVFTFTLQYQRAKAEVLRGEVNPTKRMMLQVIMSIFDPLGFLAFFTIYAKIILQDVWRAGIQWDDQLPEPLFQKWRSWINHLPQIHSIRIPRHYFNDQVIRNLQLHVFVDASEDAYAAVAYFRFQHNDIVHCSIVAAKAKVAPLKSETIPRLELQAAVISARLAINITKGHQISVSERFFWTDSTTILSWLRTDPKRLKPFVRFRIGEIQESTRPEDWKWTRGGKIPEISINSRWLIGPEFLKRPSNEWPNYRPTEELKEDTTIVMVHLVESSKSIDFTKFSCWMKISRIMGYVIRFITNLRKKRNQQSTSIGALTYDEILIAQQALFRTAQQDCYTKEINILSCNNQQASFLDKTSLLYKCSPYMDKNGTLRVRGRIDRSPDVPYEHKRPIILPRQHHITYLLIKSFHQKYHHVNHETVINELRQQFYISRLRAALKKVRKDCTRCKIDNAVPRPPEMAELPKARLAAFMRPFSYTGIDYFGPLYVTVGRHKEKRWGVLFTCLTIRAVHIEIAYSLTADSCIMAIRNFISRRGTPVELFSDNGTNFIGADRELRESIKQLPQQLITSKFANIFRWNFNTPLAPHTGGCWERLIGSVKRTLYRILPDQRFSDETLRAALMEIENIINSRPLTYVPLDDQEEEALTPNHLLLGSSNGTKAPGVFVDKDLLLRKNWRISQRIADYFWQRWVAEYLPTLTRRTKWFHPVKPIKVGDVVIVVDEKAPRNEWKKGIVEQIYPRKDSQVGKAIVRTREGVYERGVTKLAMLDVGDAARRTE